MRLQQTYKGPEAQRFALGERWKIPSTSKLWGI